MLRLLDQVMSTLLPDLQAKGLRRSEARAFQAIGKTHDST